MKVAKGLKHCMHQLQPRSLMRIAWDLPRTVSSNMDQQRGYRSDDPRQWTAQSGENASDQVNQIYGHEPGFDPRYDDRHYRTFKKSRPITDHQTQWGYSDPKDMPDTRRRISQAATDHQRRQERIIEDNKRRWKNRSEPRSQTNVRTPEHVEQKLYMRADREETHHGSAEENIRLRRHQHLAELRRQERVLRESRKRRDQPPPQQEAAGQGQSQSRKNSWMEQREREDEAQYWHTWSTCPDERTEPEPHEEMVDTPPSYKNTTQFPRRSYVDPPVPFDRGVRRYQTAAQQHRGEVRMPPPRKVKPPASHRAATCPTCKPPVVKRRKPKKALPLLDDIVDDKRYELQPYVHPMERSKLQRPLPRPADKNWTYVCRRKQRKAVKPPRFQMKLMAARSLARRRKRTPIDSFSSQIAVNTQYIPHSEYIGYGRQTVCDVWKNFSSAHNTRTCNGNSCRCHRSHN